MEAFSLLKYWRGGGGGGGGGAAVANIRAHTTGTTTIATSVREKAIETDDDDDDDDGDEGPFFDLEFAVPDDEDGDSEGGDEHDSIEDGDSHNGEEEEDDNESAGTDGEQEFNFTVSSGSNGGPTDPNLSLSPSDDLFFKGRLVPLESSSLVFNPSESNSKPQFPVSLLKSATKFRVFMLGFKKAKSTTGEKIETNGATTAAPSTETPKPNQQQQSSKSFTVKFKVEEVPIVSLFTRDSSKSSGNDKQQKPNTDEASSDEKRFSKDVVQKYLKMIKPLYVKVSRRYGEKLKFSGQLSSGLGKTAPATISTPISSPTATTTTTTKKEAEAEETEAGPATSNVKISKPANLPAGLRVVCKHLGKSRSASSAVAAVPASTVQAKRKDDSLLQQQDGIQSAILHCKKSFNASRDSDSSLLSRCTSDSTQEKYTKSAINSSEEGKDNSICSVHQMF